MTSLPHPGACSTNPLLTLRGACKKGFQLVRVSWFWNSVAMAVRLFHNLGSFAPSDLSTHAFWTGSSEFPTFINTRQFGPSGEKAVWHGIARVPILLHGAMVRGGGAGNLIPFAYGKMCRPHSCLAKVRTWILFSFAEPEAAGRQNGKTWVGCAQKTSWLVKDHTKPTRWVFIPRTSAP